VIAYKFLTGGAVGRFSEFAWPGPAGGEPGEWVEIDRPLEECSSGIHACRVIDLPAWIDDELWLVELGGEIRESESMVVAERGRLLRRVDAWSERTATAFVEACALRAREQAFRDLRRQGLTAEADDLVTAHDLRTVQARAVVLAPASEAAAFAADAVALAGGRRPGIWEDHPGAASADQSPGATAANLAFVVAHAAGREALVASGDESAYARGFAAERAWQVEWLRERLGLDAE
jgi:hypothetical protein